MKKFVRAVAFTLCLLMATGVIVRAEAPLSTGLEIISAETRLIKCSVGGERVSFGKAEIKELVGKDFDYLTLNTLPPLSCGVLKVAGVDAVPGQKLSAAGLELLSFLASHPNRVFTRDQLLDEVWGFEYYGDSRTIDVHIKRLREKLEGTSEKWGLKTVWGVGYKFEVTEGQNAQK